MTVQRSFRLTIAGQAYDVCVGDLGSSPVRVVVNGQEFEVDLEAEQPGEAPPGPTRGTGTQAAATGTRAAGAPGVASVTEAGRGPAGVGAAGRTPETVVAPMPGNIVDIKARADQRVAKGDVLCYLEAMKMNNAIHAPTDGVIAEVSIVEGQVVTHGQVLVVYGSR